MRFIAEMLSKWKSREANHSLTVVFFSRVFFGDSKNRRFLTLPLDMSAMDAETHRKLNIDESSERIYEDIYKVVLDNETRSDWESLLPVIKSEFYSFSNDLKLGSPVVSLYVNRRTTPKFLNRPKQISGYARVPSLATQVSHVLCVYCLS
jgi:hypothetical protein